MPALGAVLNPEEDPQFLGFLRGAGIDEANLRAEVARRVGALQREAQNALPDYANQQRDAMENISGDALSRGVFRGGRRLVLQQRATDDIARRRGTMLADNAAQQGDLQSSLAEQVANIRRQTAEQAVNSRQGLALDAAKLGLR